ncbi:MAG: glycosyltransferase [Candidatus Diapherotrites archaeon]|nr:glycosyltransferase [Candidatus Diapherotrites archaeon]
MQPEISVVIPTHKRPDKLSIALGSLLQQTYPKEKYEVLVISDTKDNTFGSISKKFRKHKVKFYKIKNKCCDVKRNYGIKKAKGKIIAFTDDDCIPDKDWLEEIDKIFKKNEDIAGVEGLIYSNFNHLYEQAPENLTGGRYISANYAFKKFALEAVGGFDERYCYFAEDTDLAFKIISKGYKIVFSPTVRVFHPAKLVNPINFLKNQHITRNTLLLYKKFPKLYHEHFGYSIFRELAYGCIAWGIFFSYLLGIKMFPFLIIALSLSVTGIIYLASKARKRKYTIKELAAYSFFLYLWYLINFFVFIYYWTTLKARGGVS